MSTIFKCFSTYENKYIFDRTLNKIFKIDNVDFDVLNNIKSSKIEEKDKDMFEKYYRKGLLKENSIEVIEHPKTDILEHILRTGIKHVVLQVTQKCNLRCDYCIYSGKYDRRVHGNKRMSLETMKICIDLLMKSSNPSDTVFIGFYGGEPLLEINNITKLINYINTTYESRNIMYSMTTNATLLNKNIQNFLVDNKFSITISLDGPKDIQNINRVFKDGSGSFDIVYSNLNSFKLLYPDFFKTIIINCVVGQNVDYSQTLNFFDSDQLFDDVSVRCNYISLKGSKKEIFYDNSVLETIQYEELKAYLNLLGYLEDTFVSKILKNKILGFLYTYEKLKDSFNWSTKLHPSGSCIPGGKKLFVRFDGEFYPCEQVDETCDDFNIGSINTGIDYNKAKKLFNIGKLTEEECKNCWCFYHCTNCCVYSAKDCHISKDERLLECEKIKENTLKNFFKICLLKELGFDLNAKIS